MREVIIDQEAFADEAACRECLAREFGIRAAAPGDIASHLAEAAEPVRFVLRHRGLAPAAELDAMARIEEASDAETPEGLSALPWFDAVVAEFEHAAHANPLLDVIVYCDDLAEDEADLDAHVSAAEAIERLKRGNRAYLAARHNHAAIASDRIRELFEGGQRPYAVVVACSDSRVVPEHMFMAGLGELFVIRVAGNVIGEVELASAVYACEHLHSRLLLVLGHTHCGAIESAIAEVDSGAYCAGSAAPAIESAASAPAASAPAIEPATPSACAAPAAPAGVSACAPVTSRVLAAIGDERDPYAASVLNVRAGIAALAVSAELRHLAEHEGLAIRGAVYHTHSGVVDFLA